MCIWLRTYYNIQLGCMFNNVGANYDGLRNCRCTNDFVPDSNSLFDDLFLHYFKRTIHLIC